MASVVSDQLSFLGSCVYHIIYILWIAFIAYWIIQIPWLLWTFLLFVEAQISFYFKVKHLKKTFVSDPAGMDQSLEILSHLDRGPSGPGRAERGNSFQACDWSVESIQAFSLVHFVTCPTLGQGGPSPDKFLERDRSRWTKSDLKRPRISF